MVRYWNQAYKGSILTEQQVKEAVSAKLIAVQTREKKQKNKMLANEASSPLTAGVPSKVKSLLFVLLFYCLLLVVWSEIFVCSLECVIMPNIMCRVLKYKVEFNSKF
jgi:hypothetical protein